MPLTLGLVVSSFISGQIVSRLGKYKVVLLVGTVIVFVGYFLIPHFMKLPLTSAYEILEKPLGLKIRLLASGFFVLARLMWMSLILYVTADKLIIVMLGWPETVVPYIALAMGFVTIIYTSMGGLKGTGTSGAHTRLGDALRSS
jgi:SSS family solute:Na+ symporter